MLHDRVLLHIQDELHELEEEFEITGGWEAKPGDNMKLASRREDTTTERQDLIATIKQKLDDYGRKDVSGGSLNLGGQSLDFLIASV